MAASLGPAKVRGSLLEHAIHSSFLGLGEQGEDTFHYPASLGIEVKWKSLPSASGSEGSVRQGKAGFLLLVRELQQSLAVKTRCSQRFPGRAWLAVSPWVPHKAGEEGDVVRCFPWKYDVCAGTIGGCGY